MKIWYTMSSNEMGVVFLSKYVKDNKGKVTIFETLGKPRNMGDMFYIEGSGTDLQEISKERYKELQEK